MSSRKGKRVHSGPNHLKSDAELLVANETHYSMWFDNWWYEDNPTGGGKARAVNWFGHVTEEESLDPNCISLINAARRIVSAMSNARTVKTKKVGSVYGGQAQDCLRLCCWMHRNGIHTFSAITPEMADWYKSDLLEVGPDPLVESAGTIASQQEVETVSFNTLYRRLLTLTEIFELRQEFEDFPHLQIDEHPFRGQSAYQLAETLAISSDGWIPRIPEEVFHPVMKSVVEWVDVYAPDVLHCQSEYLRVMESRGQRRGKNYAVATDAALLKVRFDSRGNLAEPWRPGFLPTQAQRTRPVQAGDPLRGPTSQLRDLIEHLRSAASMGAQALTGIRISEVLGLCAEPRQANGWPACLTMRQSFSGAYDVFFLKGLSFKGREDEKGAPTEWLLGARPAGTFMLPFPVRAILVLDELYRPWRGKFQSEYLITSLGKGGSLPHTAPPNTKPLSDVEANLRRKFIQEHVDIPEEFADWVITSHQFRKTFAQDIVRDNPRALPAVQEHYGHASEYITDDGYVGSDSTMLRLIDDVATREAAKMMVDRVFGQVPLGGKIAETIDAREAMIRELCSGADTRERRIEALKQALSTEGIRLFTSDYMDCLFRPQHSMCHREATGSFDKDATRPLTAYRTPDNCSVCANGVINRHHVPYWVNHYRSNSDIAKANRALGDERIAAVASSRAAQAKSVLKKFGVWPLDE